MAYRPLSRRGRSVKAALFGCGAAWLLQHTPILAGQAEITLIGGTAAVVLTGCAATVLADILWAIADWAENQSARTPRGHKGTARFVRKLSELGGDLLRHRWGPYWGMFRGQPVIADFESNAVTIGTSGSGKGVGVLQPTALAIRESKVIVDFKGENAAVLADALRARGETVRILNLGNMWPDILGEGDTYNPLSILTDDFLRAGGLFDVSDDLHEMALQLYPEPDSGGQNDNRYFRDGSRTLIGFAIVVTVLVYGEGATLDKVCALLNDREALLANARWVCGKLKVEDDE